MGTRNLKAAEWLSSKDGLATYAKLVADWAYRMPRPDAEDLCSSARLVLLLDTQSRPISHHVVNLRGKAAELHRRRACKWSDRRDLLEMLPADRAVSGCTGSHYDPPGGVWELAEAMVASGVPCAYTDALACGYGGAEAVRRAGGKLYQRTRWNACLETVLGTPVYIPPRYDGPLSGRYNSHLAHL